MNARADLKLTVEGHTSHGAKFILSLKRAQSVKNYLVEKGISEKRIVAKGFGAARLKNETDPKSHQNRRVEIVFDKTK
jgi:outer membrane protein OmpA-like peptidoglycan-associated protein